MGAPTQAGALVHADPNSIFELVSTAGVAGSGLEAELAGGVEAVGSALASLMAGVSVTFAGTSVSSLTAVTEAGVSIAPFVNASWRILRPELLVAEACEQKQRRA